MLYEGGDSGRHVPYRGGGGNERRRRMGLIDKLAHSLQKFTFDTLTVSRLSGQVRPVLAPGEAPDGQIEVAG